MKILKKIGQILLCPLPLLLTVLIQFASVFIITIVFVIITQGLNPYDAVMEQYGLLLLITQFVTLAIFALWYFLAYGHKKPFVFPTRVLSGKDLGLLLVLGVALYCLILVYLGIAAVAMSGDMVPWWRKPVWPT